MMKSKQIKFLSELLQTGTVSEAIKNTGVSSSTAYKWMKEPEFKNELQKRKTEMLEEVSTTMQIGFSEAVTELMKIIKNPKTAPQVKINAIDTLFRNARPIIEEVDILNRLQALEEINHAEGDENE